LVFPTLFFFWGGGDGEPPRYKFVLY
jgi:hypothetical protein